MCELVQMEINFGDEGHPDPLDQVFAGKPLTGDELKEQGINKSLLKKASREYRDKLIGTLKKFPLRSLITVEGLTAIVGRPPEGVSPAVVGAAVNTMARRGLIRQTGKWVKPERKERHSTKIPEWEVVAYE